MNHPYFAETGINRLRSLLEPCPICKAYAGQPCQNGTRYPGLYRCPDPTCDQLYELSRDAMNCVMHIDPEEKMSNKDEPNAPEQVWLRWNKAAGCWEISIFGIAPCAEYTRRGTKDEELKANLNALLRENNQLLDLVNDLADSSECCLGPHGYCQAHAWFEATEMSPWESETAHIRYGRSA